MENRLAAQYLRVSTERQEYSLEFQRAGIETYARQYNFTVCRTYVDAAKSGLEIKHRQGLGQLLQDVLGGNCPYRSILVYDVSRWGRFQDPDEAAHYEFLCKTAGVQVHYCAEHFQNDEHLPNVILKTLKRIMAGEYSRELSEKVFAGLSRVARDGFRAGGEPGYGFRRMLISTHRTPKGELSPGERKSTSNERVTLIPGPATEVHWVREIYRMFISEHRTIPNIAKELNRLNVPYLDGRKWQDAGVRGILKNPKYKGTVVYNRIGGKLKSPRKVNPEKEWIVVPGASPPLVDIETFEAAQEVFRNRHWNLSNEQILEALRSVLTEKGTLSASAIRGVPLTLAREGYARRFGSLTRAFELVGYDSSHKDTIVHRTEIRKIRSDLMESLARLFNGEVSIQNRGPIHRNYLCLKDGTKISVRACRRVRSVFNGPTWILQPVKREGRMVTLLALVNEDNTAFALVHVLPPIANRGQVRITRNHSWLRKGVRLDDLAFFREAVKQIKRCGARAFGGERRPKGWLSEDARASISASLYRRWEAKKSFTTTNHLKSALES
jgi:DNA invertase Pin-like site-specific DNA recombinase